MDVGVYLSGGIDSSIIASTMARLAGTPVKAFTIGFEDHKYDETERATQVARKLGLDHRVLRLGTGALAPHFVKSLWHTELPFLNAHGTAKFLLSRLAASDVTVVLTGEGSDEVLAGYGQFKHDLMLDAVHENPADRAARRRLKEFLAADGPLGGITRATSYREYDRVFDLFGSYPYVVLRCLVCQKVLWPLLSKEFRRRVATVDSVAELAGRIDRSMIEGLPAPWPSQYVVLSQRVRGCVGARAVLARPLRSFLQELLEPRGVLLTSQSDGPARSPPGPGHTGIVSRRFDIAALAADARDRSAFTTSTGVAQPSAALPRNARHR